MFTLPKQMTQNKTTNKEWKSIYTQYNTSYTYKVALRVKTKYHFRTHNIYKNTTLHKTHCSENTID